MVILVRYTVRAGGTRPKGDWAEGLGGGDLSCPPAVKTGNVPHTTAGARARERKPVLWALSLRCWAPPPFRARPTRSALPPAACVCLPFLSSSLRRHRYDGFKTLASAQAAAGDGAQASSGGAERKLLCGALAGVTAGEQARLPAAQPASRARPRAAVPPLRPVGPGHLPN